MLALKYAIISAFVTCCMAIPAIAAPPPAYNLLVTSKDKLVADLGTNSPLLYLQDDRFIYRLQPAGGGQWGSTTVPPAEVEALKARYSNMFIPYNATTIVYVKINGNHYRLTPNNGGGFTQSVPLTTNAFTLVAGEVTKTISPAPPPVAAPANTNPAAAAPGTVQTPAMQSALIPVPQCRSTWPATADGNQAFGGMFYGMAVHGDGLGYSKQFSAQGSIRFRAERTGMLDAVNFYNRLFESGRSWDQLLAQKGGKVEEALKTLRDFGTHRGNGGTLRIELRPDNGEGVPSDTILASGMRDVSPIGLHAETLGTLDGITYIAPKHSDPFPAVKLDRLARVEAGRLYHIVFTQTSPTTGLVALVGNSTKSPLSPPGGPYYGCSNAVMWRNDMKGSWSYEPTLQPIFTVNYSDRMVIGQPAIAANAHEQIITSASIVRQLFTVRGGHKEVTGFHIRMRRQLGTGPLYANLTQDGTQIATISIPSSAIPQATAGGTSPLPWSYIALPPKIVLAEGKNYAIQFSTDVATQYAIGTNETPPGSARDTFYVWGDKQSQAQNSLDGGRTWEGWATGTHSATRAATQRPNADLPILFTLRTKPLKLE